MNLKSGVRATDVPFTKEQLEALEVLFPEQTSHAEAASMMYHKAGQRDVVRYVKQNIEQQINKANTMPTRNLQK